MEVKLVLRSGSKTGMEIPVPGPTFLVGRADECQLRPHSDQVSRRHCEIRIEEGSVHVRDCGSRNGTLVNGRRITAEHELKAGDRLTIGPLDFEVRLIVAVGGKKKPKVKSIEEAAARTVQAAASAGGDDQELADWLLNSDEDATPDTDSLGLQPTQRVEPDPFTNPDAAPSDKDEKKGIEVKIPGKFAATKAAAESSRAAAAETLRQLFNRK